MEEAKKFDTGKIPLGLLPFEALTEVARVLQHGAREYDAHNWRKGMAWSRLYDAALGHVHNSLYGNDHDRDTGLLHLAHATCCLLFLISYRILGLGTDDRWIPTDSKVREALIEALNRARPLPERKEEDVS